MSEEATIEAPAPSPAASAPVPSPAPAAPAATQASAEKKTEAAAPAANTAEAKPDDVKAYWPADWREKASKGDEKLAKRFGRYASPEAALEALVQAQNKISAGELKPTLAKNATPEEVAKWRTDMGIPDAPDKYDIGEKLTETQKPAFDILFKHAHATNQTPEQVKAVASAWKEIQKQVETIRAENDAAAKQAADDSLREEWGGEYRRNWNVIDNMLNTVADGKLKETILEARGPDGTKIGTNPEVARFLLSLALVQNPAGVVVPGNVGDPMKGLEDRITEIETMMRKDRKAYNDPKISGPDGEYPRLLAAREKMKG